MKLMFHWKKIHKCVHNQGGIYSIKHKRNSLFSHICWFYFNKHIIILIYILIVVKSVFVLSWYYKWLSVWQALLGLFHFHVRLPNEKIIIYWSENNLMTLIDYQKWFVMILLSPMNSLLIIVIKAHESWRALSCSNHYHPWIL